MSDFPPSGAPEDTAVEHQVEQPHIEAILQDFRDWLRQAAADSRLDVAVDDAGEPVDLHALAGHFTALRHEVNLQTKAVRGQQDQGAQTLDKLSQALELAQQLQQRTRELESKNQDEPLRPLVKTLLDTYDALALARREVERVLAEMTAAPTAVVDIELPFLARWLGLRTVIDKHLAALQAKATSENQQRQRLLDSILTGYTMSLQRLERAIAALDLQPIATVGETFDPEEMEVVEVVNDPSRRHMEVIDEARRGYHWRGRVFRFAQVRVAKSGITA